MAECIYDPDVRLAEPDQLRHCRCGQVMQAAQAGRHTLVYRCDPRRCGRHLAHVDDVEAGLIRAYRGYRVHECWGKASEELAEAMFAALQLAWIGDDGRVVPGAVRFRDPV
ncbi:MAG: hypothetical protein ACRDXX_16715 [Stackebrandtia sp.]